MGIIYIAPDNLDEWQLDDFNSQFDGIHESHPTQNDNTLCGIAIVDNAYNAKAIEVKGKATCGDCKDIIAFCKGLYK